MPPSKPLGNAVARVLNRHVAPGSRLVLGLSGGIDSVALLHVLLALRTSHPFQLACVHVHHGLSPNADAWAAFCDQLCRANGIPFSIHRVTLNRHDPAGIEAAARTARHAVFAGIDADFVLTAHHQNDQAETLLLQLFRGAGPKGLAAMAEVHARNGWHAAQLRPFLDLTRIEIERYVHQHALRWVEDESNADTVYSRNYLRHTLMPFLHARFPAAVATLARGAVLQAEASVLLEELAAIDAQQGVAGDRLDCTALAGLSPPRARNLLRWFIQQQGLRMTSERRLDEGLRQLLHAAQDACVSVAIHPGTELRRFRGGAYLVPVRACATQAPVRWQGEPGVRLKQAGWDIAMNPVQGAGLSLARLNAACVEFGVRQGGERMRLVHNGTHRSLKNLLQESAQPPWQRACVPLLWCDGQMVWASGIGFDEDYLASGNEPGVAPDCVPVIP
ncbi:MAG: tRNA lysidine(34) synthetase TilS [Thiobacillaceae bacterium]